MKTLILHIGFPKTGTTSLQINFFSQLPTDQFNYLGNCEMGNFSIEQIRKDILIRSIITNSYTELKSNSYDIFSDLETVPGFLNGLLTENKIAIYSNELLTSPFFEIDDALYRIEKIFGDRSKINYHIIMSIRYQTDLIESLYNHWRWGSLDFWYPQHKIKDFYEKFSSKFNFWNTYQTVKKFTPNVDIIPYEHLFSKQIKYKFLDTLKVSPKAFTDTLAEGRHFRKSLDYSYVPLQQFLLRNRKQSTSVLNLPISSLNQLVTRADYLTMRNIWQSRMERKFYNKFTDRLKLKIKKEQFTEEVKLEIARSFRNSNLELNKVFKKYYSEELPEIFLNS